MDIGSTSTVGAVASNSTNIGTQDFLRILTTQLSYQDPLKPLDNQQFIAQMAQFTSLDQTRQLNDRIGQLLSTQSSLQSVGLIGRTVDFTDSNNAQQTGTVTQLGYQGTTPVLTLTTSTNQVFSGISLSKIISVR